MCGTSVEGLGFRVSICRGCGSAPRSEVFQRAHKGSRHTICTAGTGTVPGSEGLGSRTSDKVQLRKMIL